MLRPALYLPAVLALAGVALGGCGARSGVGQGNPVDLISPDGGVSAGCTDDADCDTSNRCAPATCIAGACSAALPIACDDSDGCTVDSCDAATGKCVFAPRTLDEDGDGHRGPLPGFAPGAAGACGDDCDDTSPDSYPGGKELCDGVDNDCNGVVDDGATYTPSAAAAVLLSSNDSQAELGGLAFGKSNFGATFASKNESWANSFSSFNPSGKIVVPAMPVTHENTDSFSGPIVWTGSAFGIAWEDRRDGDFEIYFNRLDESGKKLGKDVRVTNSMGFSLLPDLVWNGNEFTIVWSDKRGGEGTGAIFGQRIDPDGKLIGNNVQLTPDAVDADGPRIAKGETELGLVFNQHDPDGRSLFFRTLSVDLGTRGDLVVLQNGGAASSSIRWSHDRYVIAWDLKQFEPGPTIQGAAVSNSGKVLVAARDLTTPALFARSEALLPLGDRLLLVWSAFRTTDYALYSTILDLNLDQLTPETKIVDSASDSLNPVLAPNPEGGATVAFEDRRSGTFEAYTTRLTCSGL